MTETTMPAGNRTRTAIPPEAGGLAKPGPLSTRSRVKPFSLSGLIALLFRRTIYAPRPDDAEHAGMNLCFTMQMDIESPAWLEARGTSMLPWRLPGCELGIERAGPVLEIGLIVVFRHGSKLYYHRIIRQLSETRWQTKGDTLIDPDDPVSNSDIIGQVIAVRRENRVQKTGPDACAAWLSSRLGNLFSPPGRQTTGFPTRVKLAAYLALMLSLWPFRSLIAPRNVNPVSARNIQAPEED